MHASYILPAHVRTQRGTAIGSCCLVFSSPLARTRPRLQRASVQCCVQQRTWCARHGHAAQEEGEEPAAAGHVRVSKGSFAWDVTKEDSLQLQGVNLAASPGTLTMVRASCT